MDENYEDYRIDAGYRMAIAPWRAWSYIEDDKEDFCGSTINAAQVSGVTKVGDFIDLFCGAIAPAQFSPSESMHTLEVPANPFVRASHAVGTLHPDALPVAILRYLAQIKVLHALQGQGAPLAYALSVFRRDPENIEMIPFPDECPLMFEYIASEDWQEELGYFSATKSPNRLGASWTDEDRTGRTEPLNRGRRAANPDKVGETVKTKNTNPTSGGAQ